MDRLLPGVLGHTHRDGHGPPRLGGGFDGDGVFLTGLPGCRNPKIGDEVRIKGQLFCLELVHYFPVGLHPQLGGDFKGREGGWQIRVAFLASSPAEPGNLHGLPGGHLCGHPHRGAVAAGSRHQGYHAVRAHRPRFRPGILHRDFCEAIGVNTGLFPRMGINGRGHELAGERINMEINRDAPMITRLIEYHHRAVRQQGQVVNFCRCHLHLPDHDTGARINHRNCPAAGFCGVGRPEIPQVDQVPFLINHHIGGGHPVPDKMLQLAGGLIQHVHPGVLPLMPLR